VKTAAAELRVVVADECPLGALVAFGFSVPSMKPVKSRRFFGERRDVLHHLDAATEASSRFQHEVEGEVAERRGDVQEDVATGARRAPPVDVERAKRPEPARPPLRRERVPEVGADPIVAASRAGRVADRARRARR
jgi:hypothetical protein